jgi:hypothetical protein
MFNTPYVMMLSRQDGAAARLRADYLAYTGEEIDYYSNLNKQVLGYEPPHIMLLHDNELNADMTEDLLALFMSRHYRFVRLAEADPVYPPRNVLHEFRLDVGLSMGCRARD